MSTLTFGHTTLRAVPTGARGEFPIVGEGREIRDGSWAGIDPDPARQGLLPYFPLQDYDREPRDTEIETAVLENEHLRAVFLPGLGGRLWWLTDLASGDELLHQPDAIRLGNLALRNAWFAGGVEWNLGVTGHWALTADPVFTGRVDTEAGPVLRMWEYERMLGLVWRVEAWLPADSRALLVRPVLQNRTGRDVPVYWWSNAATPLTEHSRVLVPAGSAQHFTDEQWSIQHVPVPEWDGRDVTRPAEARVPADYFFTIDPAEPKPWIAAVGADGGGVFQTSTRRLSGRKLFVWGTSPGGERWQEWLSGRGRYLEIQAGLAPTQLDYVPLPAGETLSFTEAYGALPSEPRRATTAAWNEAVESARAAIDAVVDAPSLESADAIATTWQHRPPTEVSTNGASGWGALEVAAGHLPADPATPFPPSTLGTDQHPWLALAADGTLPPGDAPAAPVSGEAWSARLDGRAQSWHDWLQLGLLRLAAGQTERGESALLSSLELRDTVHARHALAALATARGDSSRAAELLVVALHEHPGSLQLVRDALAALCAASQFEACLREIEALPSALRAYGRVRYWEAWAAVHLGLLDRARALLDEGIEIPDLREGEHSFGALWSALCLASGSTEPLPARYDFRMRDDTVHAG